MSPKLKSYKKHAHAHVRTRSKSLSKHAAATIQHSKENHKPRKNSHSLSKKQAGTKKTVKSTESLA